MTDDPAKAPTAIVEHATCLACGCLCDDIRVVVEGGRIVEAGNACAIGRPWFLAPRPGEGHPVASIDGEAAGLDEAIGRAAEILRAAKAPVICGLTETANETVASALKIADRIGAVVDLDGSSGSAARLAAFQRVGSVSASLGEVKDRADVVVFWGFDPLVNYPRHWERYSVEPRGRFVPEGRAGRFVVVVNTRPTEASRAADLFVPIDPERQAEALEVLRALVKGIDLDLIRGWESTGVPRVLLETLADRLKAARYGAFFFEPNLEWPDAGVREHVAAASLVRDLNDGRRFVAMEMGRPGNATGASTVLAWQAGAPAAVDFGLGHPRHLPGEATLSDRLALGAVDAVVIVGAYPWHYLSVSLLMSLREIPTIFIEPGATEAWKRKSTVAFDVARPGIEAGGTVARVDGVMLPLRPAIDPGLPTDREILDAIGHRLERDD